jgi:hypothetical protein
MILFIDFLFHKAEKEIVRFFLFYLHMADMDHLDKRIIFPLLHRNLVDDERTILPHRRLVVSTIEENLE